MLTNILFLFALYLCSFPLLTLSEYIVIYPVATSGHVNPMIPFAVELRKRGHEVKFTFYDDQVHFIDGYDFPYISVGPKNLQGDPAERAEHMCQNPNDFSVAVKSISALTLPDYSPVFIALNKSFHEKRPDLVISDMVAFPASDIAQKMNIPLITIIYSLAMMPPTVVPPASHVPSFLSGSIEPNPSFFQQLSNMFNSYVMLYYMLPWFRAIDAERAKHGVVALDPPKTLYIFPSVFGYEIPRVIPPSIHFVGNLWSQEEEKREGWDSETSKWLDSSPLPVLYVSIGSVAVISESQLFAMSEGINIATKQMNIRVLWVVRKNQKGRERVISENSNSEKIRIESWGEQRKILSHEKVFCFLTHGGQNSVSESLSRGKPLIVMPFFGDQPANAALVVHSGSGVKLAPKGLTSASLVHAVHQVHTSEKTFKKAAERIGKLMQQGGGAKKAADIAEQAMEMGIEHLIPPKDSTAFLIKYPYLIPPLIWLVYKIVRLFTSYFLVSNKKKNPNLKTQ